MVASLGSKSSELLLSHAVKMDNDKANAKNRVKKFLVFMFSCEWLRFQPLYTGEKIYD